MKEIIKIETEVLEVKNKKAFSKPMHELSFKEFFNEANEVLGLEKKMIAEDDLLVLDFLMKSKELDFKNLSDLGAKSIYFYSPDQQRYVPFELGAFASLLADSDYTIAYLKFLFNNLEWNIVTKKPREADASFIYNLKFDNGTLISRKNEVYWVDTKELSFNNIPHKVHIAEDTPQWIQNHKQFGNLSKYLSAISKDNYNYFIDIMASVFLPNELTTAIFWFKAEGGKGKSSFFSFFTELIGGSENVLNLKIDDFVPSRHKENYKLPFLDGKILSYDDDYSEIAVQNTGFLKQFASGRNKVVLDVKQGQPKTFFPKAQIMISTNKNPIFKSFDSGDKRRNIVFNWEGNWRENGIIDFDFLQTKDFQELFLTLLVSRAIKIAKTLREEKETYANIGYYIHNMPKDIRDHTDAIETEQSMNCKKIQDYIDDGHTIIELTHSNAVVYIDVMATHKLFDAYLKEIAEKMNYKDFLASMQILGIIPERPERIDIGDEGKKKQVYRRLR